jgi:hypothetical protein
MHLYLAAELVYANYGNLADYDRLDRQNISVRGKIVIVRSFPCVYCVGWI